VLNYEEQQNYVTIQIPNFNFQTKHLFIANNGYASKLTGQSVQPARAQVLITKPIKNLKIKGTFHLDEGYYYFRNFKNRILLGGGRNLDFEGETTTKLQTTEQIQNALEKLLSEVILPNQTFEIDQRWSGIMGVGPQKMPIVKSLSSRVHCGIRMGGMGVAIGSLIGNELADLIK
jgi:glycine/D-amino acid oxidase-like deaminating enzyme